MVKGLYLHFLIHVAANLKSLSQASFSHLTVCCLWLHDNPTLENSATIVHLGRLTWTLCNILSHLLLCILRLTEWVNKDTQGSKNAEEEKIKKLEDKLAQPKHMFSDTKYMEQIRTVSETMDDSLKQGTATLVAATNESRANPDTHTLYNTVNIH